MDNKNELKILKLFSRKFEKLEKLCKDWKSLESQSLQLLELLSEYTLQYNICMNNKCFQEDELKDNEFKEIMTQKNIMLIQNEMTNLHKTIKKLDDLADKMNQILFEIKDATNMHLQYNTPAPDFNASTSSLNISQQPDDQSSFFDASLDEPSEIDFNYGLIPISSLFKILISTCDYYAESIAIKYGCLELYDFTDETMKMLKERWVQHMSIVLPDVSVCSQVLPFYA